MRQKREFVFTNLGFEPEMLEWVDRFKEASGLTTRADAIRQLLTTALALRGIIPPADKHVKMAMPVAGAMPVVRNGKLVGWVAEL
jgi:hypothetical protein